MICVYMTILYFTYTGMDGFIIIIIFNLQTQVGTHTSIQLMQKRFCTTLLKYVCGRFVGHLPSGGYISEYNTIQMFAIVFGIWAKNSGGEVSMGRALCISPQYTIIIILYRVHDAHIIIHDCFTQILHIICILYIHQTYNMCRVCVCVFFLTSVISPRINQVRE